MHVETVQEMLTDLLLIYPKKTELADVLEIDLATVYRCLQPDYKPAHHTYMQVFFEHRANLRRIAAKRRKR